MIGTGGTLGTVRTDAAGEVGDPDDLGERLREVAAVLRAATDAVVRPTGLSAAQYSCLRRLAQAPGSSGADLARATYVSRQSTHVLLRAMEADGLVSRTSMPGRGLAWWLTPRGEQRLAEAHRAVAGLDERLRAAVEAGEVDVDAVRRTLDAVVGLLADPDTAGSRT